MLVTAKLTIFRHLLYDYLSFIIHTTAKFIDIYALDIYDFIYVTLVHGEP
jgi:hypothetical protein